MGRRRFVQCEKCAAGLPHGPSAHEKLLLDEKARRVVEVWEKMPRGNYYLPADLTDALKVLSSCLVSDRRDLEKRFADKVMPEPNTGCWLWLGQVESNGYGIIQTNRSLSAHRFSYEQSRGKIPEGLNIDHLCRVRSCVNPDHLEAVTQKENVIRGMSGALSHARSRARTHCKNGHLLDEANTAWVQEARTLRRKCRTCQRQHSKKHYRSKQTPAEG